MNNFNFKVYTFYSISMVLSQNEVLLNSLRAFYIDNKKHYDTFRSIVNKECIISLRILDFFVTTYAKQNKTVIPETKYAIHQEYKNQLKGYNKTKFDPFSRTYKNDNSQKIDFDHPHGNIQTTIGQLNFFRWALSNRIIEYLERHYHDVSPLLSRSTKKKNVHSTTQCSQDKMLVSSLI